MEFYVSERAAIIGLHENGFTEDFAFSGNNILWVQQRVFLSPEEVTVIELHRFGSTPGHKMTIVALISNFYCVKGILITHQMSHRVENMSVINKHCITQARQVTDVQACCEIPFNHLKF
jgi:hypothetical protein